MIKKEIVDKAGGFRRGYEGSQDYDLFLRCLQYINNTEIGHIEHILYHWRAIEGSNALDPIMKKICNICSNESTCKTTLNIQIKK